MSVSTLLFKFDGLGDVLSRSDLKPGQISDFATGVGVWRDTPEEVMQGEDSSSRPWAFDRHGNEWSLGIHLNYFKREDENGNMVPNNLVHKHVIRLSLKKFERCSEGMSDAAIARSLDYTVLSEVKITARDSDGVVFGEGWSGTSTSSFKDASARALIDRFMMRSEVLDEANNLLTAEGSFILGMEVKDTIVPSSINIPRIVQSKKMMKLLDSAKDSDVEFNIGSTTFPAHKLILTMHAPLLASFFENATSVEIKNTLPEVFRFALEYLYGYGKPDLAFLLEHSMAIIDLADRFELIELKLEAEAALISSFAISPTNVVEQIVFADQKTCALLKEFAIRLFVNRLEEVVVSDSFKDFAKSQEPELLAELMLALRPETPSQVINPFGTGPKKHGKKTDVSMWPVNALLRELIERDLNVDGTKEILRSRLLEAMPNVEGK